METLHGYVHYHACINRGMCTGNTRLAIETAALELHWVVQH